jgi:hypothetical protein
MNVTQMRQTLETILGYYSYTKQGGLWVPQEGIDCPGWYYLEDQQLFPAIFTVGRQRVNPKWAAVGLETTIVEVPRPKYTHNMRTRIYTVYIRQFDQSLTIEPTMNLIGRHFGKDASATYYRQDETDLNDRATVFITTTDFDLPTWSPDVGKGSVPSPLDTLNDSVFVDQ